MTTISAQTILRNYGAEREARRKHVLRLQKRIARREEADLLEFRAKMHVGPWFIDPADGLPTRYVKGL